LNLVDDRDLVGCDPQASGRDRDCLRAVSDYHSGNCKHQAGGNNHLCHGLLRS
jgi:hypothetical protein